ncbi:hydantoinase/oxoprolinase family protein [Siccirubricoccus sp. KC 17139]|uniref:Hydantoinase/oxoprolinase family protein n=1 Tax=Siccirubricoccus soli TaxID=2899147 RepID=A0ABT1DA97_9PROT|nr:hydantoinase/oxoprolinase family protein [Siccirubricoccus soli]MCO6418109.1 hydantoinase/oxoprolinase family protein [Siccirubricoccus soli]MCP2684244.1 hydantoinase/oxoprolinase family protein [Siccirubricoccus soli]
MLTYRIGIDVGGTFPDVVGIASDGSQTLAKAASTPADQSEGVVNGLANLAKALGLDLATLLGRTERIVHGTTVATNALLEKKGARLALLTTEGHRDVIEMREGLKPERYNMRMPAPAPLVPRRLRLPVAERLRADGSVLTPLDPASLAAAIEAAKAEGVEAVAIAFLHAWAQPVHENQAAEAVRAALPGVFVTTSAEVLPQIKEFERFSTTAVNAYVGPVVSRYLAKLAGRLEGAGYAGPLFVILSHGGIAPVEEAARLAVGTALSGPAGGVAAAVALAKEGLGQDLITFDMGGTSTDIALVVGGEAALGRGREVGGERIALESLDIVTLGAGGGSIGHLGPGGTLQVGPRSAGAVPGPACYGQGGTEPTVTDANLVLGYLDPANFLGGAKTLDLEAAQAAVARLAAQLGIPPLDCAAGIHALVNARMADGVRVATVRRGVDPRDSALLAFGGAAGLHATAVARELGLKRAAVPLFAAGLSAWGMLHTDLRYELAQSAVGAGGIPADAELRRLFDSLESQGRSRMAGWYQGEVTARRSADMRYGEQVFEIAVPLDGIAWDGPDLAGQLRAAFHARHRALFTYDLPEEEVVLVNARVAVVGALPMGEAARREGASGPAAPLGTRRIAIDGMVQEAPVFGFDALAAGQEIAGPALIESATTTVLLRPGDAARMDGRGWLDIALT